MNQAKVDKFADKIKETNKDIKDKSVEQLGKAKDKLGEWKDATDKKMDQAAEKVKDAKDDVKEKIDEVKQGDTWENIKHTVVDAKDATFKRIEDAVDYISTNVGSLTHDVRQKLSDLLAPRAEETK